MLKTVTLQQMLTVMCVNTAMLKTVTLQQMLTVMCVNTAMLKTVTLQQMLTVMCFNTATLGALRGGLGLPGGAGQIHGPTGGPEGWRSVDLASH